MAGPNLTPALIMPGKKFGLPPLQAVLSAFHKVRNSEYDKALNYTFLADFILLISLVIDVKNFSSCLNVIFFTKIVIIFKIYFTFFPKFHYS